MEPDETDNGPAVVITAARVDTGDGRAAATIELVDVGGGSQVVTVDGTPEERIHPRSTVYHVRLLAPTRMLADELREAATFQAAVELAGEYARRVARNAETLAAVVDDLKV